MAGGHLYVMGSRGVGRRAVLESALRDAAADRPPGSDLCYVSDFREPRCPKALHLAPGLGRRLAADMERLVEDLEGETRGLIEYLGIPWSDQCLRFFDNKRMVTTASMTQVRRPVYRDSVGRWRRYRDHLAPLLEALGDLRQYQIDED